MKLYTRSGDKGTTSLVYGERVPKNDIRVEAYGTCDEANSMIGLALSYLKGDFFQGKETLEDVYHKIQTTLFHVGAQLSTPEGKKINWTLKDEDVTYLEKFIDAWNTSLPALTQFILPGGHPAGAAFHVARTIVRRAERIAVALSDEVSPLVLSYLNRLSDLLFVTARYVNSHLGTKEQTLHQS
ncbi:cob(I)yrinic acid a,c-diamide adenosyltransferase [Bacillus aquiflavi]|uniref:Corrinoid adenosyltransferase n=1 Tax=Bacillus aquiflavi TaxID=2672567 RepID=A0A6B3VUM6_9BACI|nr:cob(I)yrinic acid a,c-diamide adenosyltransferase [Bacillus aquiflavi]MBA4536294.1 cob(I)yrinic acid a,c-diamide adenosyltransferase [Bacillus aquiflavi]NEY80662.1 cob(I)yrinic acid a,c-diamide adenosyltransferase [Bacillus aquiflavi]UAC48867.1 cob(I)yrinic acid a,c-diamide adenosyltransferase [Bacillus aquiflavi]